MREDEEASVFKHVCVREGCECVARKDWINLLSLRCAFIPNGSDMSRAQHYLPSHCTGKGGRTHGKNKREQER